MDICNMTSNDQLSINVLLKSLIQVWSSPFIHYGYICTDEDYKQELIGLKLKKRIVLVCLPKAAKCM